MNKSWKSFDVFKNLPSTPLRQRNLNSSNSKKSAKKKLQLKSPVVDDSLHISDASEDESCHKTVRIGAYNLMDEIENCSPIKNSGAEEIEENVSRPHEEPLLSSSDDDFDNTITCKRQRKCLPLPFFKKKPTTFLDETLNIVTCLDRKSKNPNPIPESPRRVNKTLASPPSIKWKNLNKSFHESDDGIEITVLTPETEPPDTPTTSKSFYEPPTRTLTKFKYKKGCPVSKLQLVLNEAAASRNFWQHGRQVGLIGSKTVATINHMGNVYGRVMISFELNDEENIIYLDPKDKILLNLKVGSSIEVEFDILGHRISDTKIVHLGVCKINEV